MTPDECRQITDLWTENKLEQAEVICRAHLKRDKDDVDALHLLAGVLVLLDQLDEARVHCERVLSLEPHHAGAINNLGSIHYRRGELIQAEKYYKESYELTPTALDVLINLGAVYYGMHRYRDAEMYYALARRLAPDNADVLVTQGLICTETHRRDEALKLFRKALEVDDKHPNALSALLRHAILDSDYNQSIKLCQRITELGNPKSYAACYSASRTLCLWEYVPKMQPVLVDWVLQGKLGYLEAASIIMVMLAPDDIDNATHLKINCKVGGHYEDIVSEPPFTDHPLAMENRGKLKIGYMSPDFYNHVVSSFIRGLINFYDKSRFEVYCYSNTQKPDELTDQYKMTVDRFVDITQMSDPEVAHTIREDGIHILVDLAGYTMNSRLGVMAYRPAPIQISYLGYPYSLGLKCIDYILADPYLAGDKYADYCVETPLLLPESAFCFGDFVLQRIHAVPAFQRNGHVSFGTLINPYKLNPHTIEIWSRILHRTPGSVIKFVHFYLTHEISQKNLRDEFAKHGIEAERVIIITERYPGDGIHLNYYNDFDICLDSFPMTGGVTSMESMWMGTPVVTLVGDAHSERISYSLIKNIPLPLDDLVSFNLDEYVEKAVALATNTARIAELLQAIPAALRRSILTDPVQFAKHMESTYVKGWNQKFPDLAVTPISTKKPVVMVPGPQGIEFALPESLEDNGSYIIQEFQGWYDAEYSFVLDLVQPGEGVMDIAASYGMYIAPLARKSGTGRCRAIVTPGKVFSFIDLTKTHNELDNLSIVPIGNHDIFIDTDESTWDHITFVRMGNECHLVSDGIVNRCAGFFENYDPVIMVPLRHGNDLNLTIATDLKAKKYDLYRLVPGIGVLTAYRDVSELDSFALNLFAIKESRARILEQRGLLVRKIEGVTNLPQAGDTAYVDFLRSRPYTSMFPEGSLGKDVDEWSDIYRMALNLYVQAHDPANRAAQRLASLDSANKMLLTLCTSKATFPRMLTLCRVLTEQGQREQAFNVISRLIITVHTGGNVDVEEPFVPANPAFEQFHVDDTTFPNWALTQLYETRERLRSFSSYFTASETLEVLQQLENSPFLSDDMRRRLLLIRQREQQASGQVI